MVEVTGSTNADCLNFAAAGAAEGFWLRAERQDSGRGRQGRAWHSPPGNLYASTIVRLRPGDPPAPTLALVSAVALYDAVETLTRLGQRVRIKWPNDLLVDGAKLSGILMERAGDAVVIGFGVNLSHAPDVPDRRTVALAGLGIRVTAQDLVEVLADGLADWLARWRGEGLGPVRSAWLSRSHTPGTSMTTHLPDGERVEGRFLGIDDQGALILESDTHGRLCLHAADVFLA